VGKYSITFKDDLLLISEGQSVVASLRAPHAISDIGSAGERIGGVGGNNGEVLLLRADWLVESYETENMSAGPDIHFPVFIFLDRSLVN